MLNIDILHDSTDYCSSKGKNLNHFFSNLCYSYARGGGKGPVISYARGGEGREGGIWCHSDIYRNSPVVFYIQQLCVIVLQSE